MKKNLKKVISAVLALTLAMSSFVAMTTSAATFADVADTASYAEAVNALAALGAIAGTGDGTFKPDDNITRAEAATMVVAALNLSADAQNAGSTSKFADVNEQAKWAVGYVNVGVAQNYISGTSATTFNPLDNVTYAQMLTMLTRILGYGDFAVSRGGYPNGYVTAAATAGIVKGVVAGTEEPITRAQAAQLIWNAVQAPMLDITTFTGTIADTELKKMDGSIAAGNKFKTVLSEKFNAYVLNAVVTATDRSNALEDGNVKIKLINNNEWDPEQQSILRDANTVAPVYEVAAGKTDAANNLFASAKVVASYTSFDDEWNLIYFAPNAKVTKKVVDGTLINAAVESDTNYNGVIINTKGAGTSADPTWYETVLNIKKSAGVSAKNSNDYKLKNADLYVNGFFYDDLDTGANTAEIRDLIANSTGDMVLIENDGDQHYDVVMIDVYAIAQVTQVKTSADKTTVRFTALTQPSGAGTPGTTYEATAADIEDGDKVVSVVKDGVASTLDALAINDVVAIKYDFGTTGNATSYGKYVDIIASTKTATGVYTSYDSDTDLYTVGGVQYEDIGGALTGKNTGDTFTLRLDAFDRVFSAEVEVVSKNYAIVERFVKTDEAGGSEYDYIDVVTLDGQQKRLFIDSNFNAETVLRPFNDDADSDPVTPGVQVDGVDDENDTDVYGDPVTANHNITASYTTNNSVTMDKRFISYKVRPSTGRVTAIVMEAAVSTGSVYYNATTNRLGGALAPSAVVLDAVAYTNNGTGKLDPTLYKASSLSTLVENVAYEAYLLHKSDVGNKYAYVVLTSAGALYSTNSDFAVVASTASSSSKVYDNDEDLFSLKVVGSDGKDKALQVAMTAKLYVNGTEMDNGGTAAASYEDNCDTYLTKGSVFFYTVDQYGYVDRIDVIFTNATTQSGMQTALRAAFDPTSADSRVKLHSDMVTNDVITADWKNMMDEGAFSATQELVQVFIAPVLSATANSVSFAEIKAATAGDGNDDAGVALNGKLYVDTSKDYSFSIATDANIYAVDAMEIANKGGYELGAFQGIRANYADDSERAWLDATVVKDNASTTYEYDFTDDVQYALVMAVDGVVTNAVVFDNVQ
ncbi:MAG: S-layer homology domain-containing protein [Clostridia bacterium]|nr:S-layer homology domain-containing protein [Clostridia bacterium]